MNKKQHTIPYFKTQDNELLIGKKTATELYQQFQRPFYAYDKHIIKKSVQHLQHVLPARIDLHYAIKANPLPELVEYMAELVSGMDLASSHEMEVALKAGVPAAELSFAGPAKENRELEKAIKAGVTLNLESVGELKRVIEISKQLKIQAKCAVRVNPDFELKASGMKMSGGSKPFGIDAEQVPDVIKEVKKQGVHFRGLHIFSGSQNLRAESLIETHQQVIKLALEIAEQAQTSLDWLNIGGGLGVPYFAGEQRLELEGICANLTEVIQQVPSETQIVMELGRYLVAEAGVYICKIIDRKVSRGQTYLVTNGGLHHHLAASGNFGQIIRKDYPLAVANKINQTACENVAVVGPLCTPLDILASKADLPKAQENDLIAVFQSGAYGFTASPHLFLSHPKPYEVLL